MMHDMSVCQFEKKNPPPKRRLAAVCVRIFFLIPVSLPFLARVRQFFCGDKRKGKKW